MKRWIDVDALDWFFKDTIEFSDIVKDSTGTSVINGLIYDVFKKGRERVVKRFITVEGQVDFIIPEYTYHADNPLYVLVNNIAVVPESVSTGKVTLSNPMSAGIEVVCIAYGVPDTKRVGCVDMPYELCGLGIHPNADLKHKSTYFFSMSYYQPETCTVMGTKLRRLIVNISAGEDVTGKIRDAIGYKTDVFVIHKGIVYLPYTYAGFPAEVGYNATIKGVNKRTVEKVIVESECVKLNDRFFPDVRMRRGEFFGLLFNLASNLQNRYTDTPFTINKTPTRTITDLADLNKYWYADAVKTMFSEKMADGCYAFPLYHDDKFEGEACITRAEIMTYLNIFIKWTTEKFR